MASTDTMAERGGLLTSDGGGSPAIPYGPSASYSGRAGRLTTWFPVTSWGWGRMCE